MNREEKRERFHIQVRKDKKNNNIIERREKYVLQVIDIALIPQGKLIDENDSVAFSEKLAVYIKSKTDLNQPLNLSQTLVEKIIISVIKRSQNYYEKAQMLNTVNKICVASDYTFITHFWNSSRRIIPLLKDSRVCFKMIRIVGNSILGMYFAPQSINEYLSIMLQTCIQQQNNQVLDDMVWLLAIVATVCVQSVINLQNIGLMQKFIERVGTKVNIQFIFKIINFIIKQSSIINLNLLQQLSKYAFSSKLQSIFVYKQFMNIFLTIVDDLEQNQLYYCQKLFISFFYLCNTFEKDKNLFINIRLAIQCLSTVFRFNVFKIQSSVFKQLLIVIEYIENQYQNQARTLAEMICIECRDQIILKEATQFSNRLNQ